MTEQNITNGNDNRDQRSWDLALKCHKDDESVYSAIETVWDEMPPPGRLNTLAAIIEAIYADQFWVGTRLNQEKLSAELHASIGISKRDCDRAARYAFARWHGLFVRANLQGGFEIPKTGNLTSSPDVVVNGETTLNSKRLLSLWNQYVYTPKIGLKNHVY